MAGRSRREVMAKLEIVKAIFWFISTLYLNQQTKPILFGLLPVLNLKIVYLATSFSDVYSAVRGKFIQLKTSAHQYSYVW